MNKILLILSLFLVSPVVIFTQGKHQHGRKHEHHRHHEHGKKHSKRRNTDANVVGDVKCNGKHVPFIHVTVKGTAIGTVTDATGHYQLIDLPVGTFEIVTSGVGYKSSKTTVTTSPNQTKEIKFDVEEDVFNMEEVVVTASRNQTNRAEAPVIVTSVKSEVFSQTQSVNLAEGLNFSPGLRTECNCQNCGFTQLRMNGLEGPYSQILMNSRPIFSGLAGVYGLELIPVNMVERIEVVRGGGSALFGGNAIAGTVNIITREADRNSFMIDGRTGITGLGSHEGTSPSLDQQLNVNASMVSNDRKTGGYIYAMLRDRDQYDENGDGFSESVLLENSTFGLSVYHKPGTKSKISLDAYRVNEFRRGGNDFHKLPHETNITEQVRHLVTGANLSFDAFTNENYNKLSVYASAQSVSRDSYYGAQQDPDAYGKTGDIMTTLGAQYVMNAENFVFASSSTVFGIENNNNTLEDIKLGANGRENTLLAHQMVNTLGSFVQHDWKSQKFNLSLGLRYDYYLIRDLDFDEAETNQDITNSVLVPRASILFKINPALRLRFGYAKGYRAPQIFNEDLHIDLVNAKRVLHFNDENLTQEISHSFTSSLNTNFFLGNTVNEVLIEGFVTLLKDPFADEYYPLDSLGSFAYQRINAESGARVAGVNIEWNSHISEKLDLQLGFTLQKSRFEEPQAWGEDQQSVSKNFMRTPDGYGYSTLNFQASDRLNTSVTLNYTGPMDVPHFGLNPTDFDGTDEYQAVMEAIENGDIIEGERLERSENFFIVDILFSYDIPLSNETDLQLYAGIKNLFNQTQRAHDRGLYRDAGYIYGPCKPRTINFGLKIGNFLK